MADRCQAKKEQEEGMKEEKISSKNKGAAMMGSRVEQEKMRVPPEQD